MKNLMAAGVAVLASAGVAAAEEAVLNIYNWSDYIAEDTIANFEAETGIKVNYDVFDSNEVVEAKMLTGSTNYDIVVPSLEFMARQAQAGVFQEIDRAQIANYGNLDPKVMEIIAANDPGNAYGVPYMMYTVGLGYNRDKVAERLGSEEIDSWSALFDPAQAEKLQDCGIALLDSPSEMTAAALNYLGLDPTSEKADDLEAATELMKGVRPFIRYFHSSQYINDLANGDICLAVGYSGDILQARDRADEAGQGVRVAYEIPKEGALVGFDMLVIPSDAPHPENAHKFVDYFLRPEVSAAITNYVYYANANQKATELVDEAVRNDPGIYPAPEVMAKMYSAKPHSQRYDRSLTRAWTSLKTGQ
ncbi:polyamine ABC transporter substrate-binding protein [Sedimentimonas flavescens]|uniref:polyamine ABC transporter substrate-binding protein n=1 Tax=Sedimentimonas flavescens TaxID=2851012 RepID=UPI0021A61CE2|nr:polyamine ABC transporter substrate-binding protein [Sedimentimonas flavescens]MCT2539714.1 polyamine ABC transporter substrate-binding protein [Sedimentimonas flavescens]